jgi:hypothetical protein
LYPFPAERQQKLNIISGPVRGILLYTSPHNIVHWEKTEPIFLNVYGIDSKERIPPAYVAWRAGTITLFLLGS